MAKQEKNPQAEEKLPAGESTKLNLYFWVQAAIAALTVIMLLFTFVARGISVSGSSMYPTLHDKDMMIVRSIGYTPQNGDIVVLTKPSFMSEPIVKRVIATGGQTVHIDYDTGTVYVDGIALQEDYINEVMEEPDSFYLSITDTVVPEGYIFVMGDNRNNSSDSRDTRLGLVDERYVLGKAEVILMPFSRLQKLG